MCLVLKAAGQEVIDTVPLRNVGDANMSPDTAFEVMSGLETLGLRMERHCENAIKVKTFIEDQLIAGIRYH